MRTEGGGSGYVDADGKVDADVGVVVVALVVELRRSLGFLLFQRSWAMKIKGQEDICMFVSTCTCPHTYNPMGSFGFLLFLYLFIFG